MDQFVIQPIVQYAFAGFCAVQITIIVWLVRELIKVIKENNRVIANNAKMIAANNEALREQSMLIKDNLKLNRRVHDRLLGLHCFAEAAARAERDEAASGGVQP